MQDSHRQVILQNSDKLANETSDAAFEVILGNCIRNRVLNDHMVTKIRNANSTLESKKIFYEMVPKRGPDAFRILLDSLTLANLQHLRFMLEQNRLFLEGNFPNNNGINNGTESDGGCFAKSKHVNSETYEKPEEVYLLKSKPKGYVLIINIYTFLGVPGETRTGSDIDVNRLKKEFKKRGFEVIVKNDLMKWEFENFISSFTQMDELKKVDSFFLFVMTHGKQENEDYRKLRLSMHDRVDVDAEWIIQQFNSLNCKNLAGKPKIIVFQACRGDRKDRGVAIQLDSGTLNTPQIQRSSVQLIPTLSDLLVVYSTLPGYVAERHPEKGSFFIQGFCDVMENKKEEQIFELLNQVSRSLREKFLKNEMRFSQGLHWENLRFDKRFIL